jgi:putative ABC transport system substrate-binding protein
MRRRQFITLLGGAATWPLAARAQQPGGMRRVGVLHGQSEDDLQVQASLAAFRDGLAKLGWIEGGNLRIEVRFGNNDPNRNRGYAVELVSLAPDVIVTATGSATREVQKQTQTIPIVISGVGDPVALGLVKNLARPEGNITGFNNNYPSLGSKWLELLKEAAPTVTRVAVLFNPEVTPDSVYIPSIETAASVLAVRAIMTPIRNAIEIVRAIDAFAAEPNGGLLVLPNNGHRETILQLAVEHRLPAISANRFDAAAGSLLAYASDAVDRLRRVASYVDRILRGAKVSELPVQFPTSFDLVINLRTAKAIGLTVPPALLTRADEVIE